MVQRSWKKIDDIKNLKFIPTSDGKSTSPDFVSIPILKNETSTIMCETRLNDLVNINNRNMEEFIQNLDKINFD